MDARGPHVRPAFDDALNAYDYVLDGATRSIELTEKWIKDLHAIICASQGSYRVYTERTAGQASTKRHLQDHAEQPNSP
jgi:Fic family protein